MNIPFTNVNISGLPSPTLCVHNNHQWSARANSIRDPRWKEANPLAPQGVRKHYECTHPKRKSREARREVGRMYPHRILIREKGVQVLQLFDPTGADKSRRRFRRIGILV